MGRRTKTFMEESAVLNNRTYAFYLDDLTQLALSRFKWEGLPVTVNARYLERGLLMRGGMLYFNDPIIGNLCLHYAIQGRLDVYDEPIQRRVYANNGYHTIRSGQDSVIIYNNMLKKPDIEKIRLFARKLYNLDRIIDINCNGQKTPGFLRGTEKQMLTLKNLFMEYDGNVPVIYADAALDPEELTYITTGAPFISDRIYDIKAKYINECLTYLGFSNITFEKGDRMVRDEVIRQLGGAFAHRNSPLLMRQEAADQINAMFGQNIKVSFNEDLGQEFINKYMGMGIGQRQEGADENE